jgi:hypothetical protein
MTTLPDPPVIPSGDEIYDSIMGKIEPELTTAELPKLAAKYKGESRAEADVRKNRYNAAFATYYKEFRKFTMELRKKVQNYHRTVIRFLEEWMQKVEEEHLTSIDKAIKSV